ncbi:cellulose biosynthesis protein BcsN [Fulvimarina sp. MAC8]|uniref:cellulose biosynthesis protein BcsN n=1 Tax=Fulvimarina sp. MAC8 TaxID=3162874 RepID=UPI0032F03DD6
MRHNGNRGLSSLPALVAFLFVSACSTTGQPRGPERTETVALSEAFVIPSPGGPALVEVLETRYPNATQQKILLRNEGRYPGQDFLLVQYFGPVGATGSGRTPLSNQPLFAANIDREIKAEFPNITMLRSPTYVQNRYGPFGYAVGRSNLGETCLYAWQRISGGAAPPMIFRSKGTIEMRLRQCGTGNAENRLLATMYGLTIRAFFSNITWDPYPSPPGADPRLGASGSPIYPLGSRGFERVIEAEPAENRPRVTRKRAINRDAPSQRQAVRRVPASQSPAPEPVSLPAPIGPPVPPPPGSVQRTRPSSSQDTSVSVGSETSPAPTSLRGPAVPPPPPTAQN